MSRSCNWRISFLTLLILFIILVSTWRMCPSHQIRHTSGLSSYWRRLALWKWKRSWWRCKKSHWRRYFNNPQSNYTFSFHLFLSGIVKREDLFITTKLWNTFHERDQVVPAIRKSLKNLGMDYIDLYLIHWPVAAKVTEGEIDINFPFKVVKKNLKQNFPN